MTEYTLALNCLGALFPRRHLPPVIRKARAGVLRIGPLALHPLRQSACTSLQGACDLDSVVRGGPWKAVVTYGREAATLRGSKVLDGTTRER